MKNIILSVTVVLVGCGTTTQARPAPAIAQTAVPAAPVAQTPAGPGEGAPAAPAEETGAALAAPAPPTDNGLNDLAAMTFGCPKAALNAAAREAAKVPSQGTYQFAYFGIVSDSHHAAYEVHFKSNYQAESLLKYCVAIYCQQGWDPRTTKAAVSLMADTTAPSAKGRAKDREPLCGDKHMHVGALRSSE
jgi:hypothetical protein